MADLTALILTYNEEKNIEECINSIKPLAERIVVIDSFSTDRTVELAESLGAEVHKHEFINYAKQYLYGIEIAGITTKWILRLDADERLTPAAVGELEQLCRDNTDTDVNGIILRFEVEFMGKKLRHGGIYPFRKLLVYKNGMGTIEDRSMDEHIVLFEGRSIELKNDCIHHDYKDLNFWIDKHNKYATREVQDYLKSKDNAEKGQNLDFKAGVKRKIKFGIYYKLPMGMRAHMYYWYRYYIKLGFLDGREGKIFAFMQAYWYRYLVDAKIYEHNINNKDA
jgi:glycosyltransferase involved in cell wall biosynthesis